MSDDLVVDYLGVIEQSDTWNEDAYRNTGDIISSSCGSFWTDDSCEDISVDSVLERKSFSLIDILDLPECIEETKSMHEKLIQFLNKTETLFFLVDIISCTDLETFRMLGNNSYNHSDKSKLELDSMAEFRLKSQMQRISSVATEVLCCNVNVISETFVNSPKVMGAFFSILDRSNPLLSELINRFRRILETLLAYAPRKVLLFTATTDNKHGHSDEYTSDELVNCNFFKSLLRNVSSFSIVTCFELLFAAAQKECVELLPEDEMPKSGISCDSHSVAQNLDIVLCDLEEMDYKQFRGVCYFWLGYADSALKILEKFTRAFDSATRTNCAEILSIFLKGIALMRHRYASVHFLEAGQCYSSDAAINVSIEQSANNLYYQWPITVCQTLCSIASFSFPYNTNIVVRTTKGLKSCCIKGETIKESYRLKEYGNAAILSLRVLIKIVDAYEIRLWSNPDNVKPFDALSYPEPTVKCTSKEYYSSTETHAGSAPELNVIVSKLPDLINCLHNERQVELFNFSSDYTDRYMGMHRLLIVELICTLLRTKYVDVIRFIAQLGENETHEKESPLAVCLTLFFRFQDNNCLHSMVTQMLEFILDGNISESSLHNMAEVKDTEHDVLERTSEGDDESCTDYKLEFEKRLKKEIEIADSILEPLQKTIFGKHCDLINRILVACKDNSSQVNRFSDDFRDRLNRGNYIKGEKRGYNGFCHRIVRKIVSVATKQQEKSAEYETRFDATDFDQGNYTPHVLIATKNNDHWNDFVEGEMAEIIALENSTLLDENSTISRETCKDNLQNFFEKIRSPIENDNFDETFSPNKETVDVCEEDDAFGYIAAQSIKEEDDDVFASSAHDDGVGLFLTQKNGENINVSHESNLKRSSIIDHDDFNPFEDSD